MFYKQIVWENIGKRFKLLVYRCYLSQAKYHAYFSGYDHFFASAVIFGFLFDYKNFSFTVGSKGIGIYHRELLEQIHRY